MIIDTSVLLAFLDRDEPAHDDAFALLEAQAGPLVVSPLVLAELNYLLLARGGVDAAVAGMREVASGAWEIASFTSEDLMDAIDVVEQYRALAIGATDASLVVLAHRYGTHTIATLDRRHFGVLRAIDGKPFDVVPA